LTERLTEGPDRINRPPFSFLFSYIGSWNEPVNWEATLDLDRYLREKGGAELGLNSTLVVRHLETRNFRLYPSGETNYRDENRSLDYVSFGTTENIAEQVELVEGVYPAPADPSPESYVDVMIHEEFASEFGIQLGEYYQGYNWRLDSDDPMQITMIRIAGIWRPLDEDDEYWFYRPNVFEDILLINEETYRNRLAPYTESEVNLAVWYLVTDGSGVNTSRVDELIRRHNDTEKIADQYLPGTYIQASPVEELRPYQRIVTVLTLTLTVFSIPIVVLLVIFLVMLVGLVVDGQRNETAVLRSRGTSPFQVVGLTTVEGIIMGVIALVVGGLLAIAFTQLIGASRSFMDFRWGHHFIVSVPPTIGSTIVLAIVFTILIRVIPTIGAARHTIISYKMDQSRLLRRPWWQRLGVDARLGGGSPRRGRPHHSAAVQRPGCILGCGGVPGRCRRRHNGACDGQHGADTAPQGVPGGGAPCHQAAGYSAGVRRGGDRV
jgi:putative ABC transport system permease protein